MPYRSKAQMAYLHIHEPKVAAKWDSEYGGGGSDLPYHVGDKTSARKRAIENLGKRKKAKNAPVYR